MQKIISILSVLLLFTVSAFSQTVSSQPEESFFESNEKFYVVIAVIAIIFTGIVIYLFSLDRKISKLEKKK